MISASRTLGFRAALVLFAAPLAAQVQEGELLVQFFGSSGGDALRHYRPDGTLVAESTAGAGSEWVGAAISDAGLWVTSYRHPTRRVALHDPMGFELLSFPAPEIDVNNGDVHLFQDGTIAVSDVGGDVELYSQAGVHLSTITAPGSCSFFGMGIDGSDELWVCDFQFDRLWHFARDGSLLGTIDPPGEEPGDVDFAADGTLWTIGRTTGNVLHLARDGTLLGSFPTTAVGAAYGIAVDPDGSLWTAYFGGGQVRHYTSGGMLLGSFPVADWPVFLNVRKGLGTSYCTPATPNSTGSPGRISASGTSEVAMNDVTLTARDLPPGEFGYFLVGSNQGQFQPPGSQGTICLTCSGFQGCAGIGRYNQIGNIIQGPVGSIAIDLTALPLTPPRAVVAGETWNFQCWFRDLGSNNFTDALAITFR